MIQLAEWGNLESQPDTARVSSLSDFYRALALSSVPWRRGRRDESCGVLSDTLLEQEVLQRVAGEEETFVHENGWAQSDALYDVQRRLLANILAAVRGPSTWRAEDAPVDFEDRLRSLVAEHVADSEQGRRDALRYHLTRRLLDDSALDACGPTSRFLPSVDWCSDLTSGRASRRFCAQSYLCLVEK